METFAYEFSEYGLPVDDYELDRLDMNHQKYTLLQENRLFLAPITPTPQKILDLGTGTGIIGQPRLLWKGLFDSRYICD